jgi:hypothetical protein
MLRDCINYYNDTEILHFEVCQRSSSSSSSSSFSSSSESSTSQSSSSTSFPFRWQGDNPDLCEQVIALDDC